jgi:hypothetical protein
MVEHGQQTTPERGEGITMHGEPSTADQPELDEPAAAAFPALQFDPDEFMHFIKDENLSEEQARALLEAIWNIVIAFVDLGFGLGPFRLAVDGSVSGGENGMHPPAALLGFRDNFSHNATGLTATGHMDRGAE